MLLADVAVIDSWISHTLTALGSVIAALFIKGLPTYVKFRKGMQEVSAAEQQAAHSRDVAVSDGWRVLYERQRDANDALSEEVQELRNKSEIRERAMSKLETKIAILEERGTRCDEQNDELRDKIAHLEDAIAKLQTK